MWGTGHHSFSFKQLLGVKLHGEGCDYTFESEFYVPHVGYMRLIQLFFLKGLASNPKYILTPFIISALLTMCKINRDLDSARLSSSVTLQFLRSVIRNNERERELCEKSAWCRLALDESVVNLDKIYSVLVDQRFVNQQWYPQYFTSNILIVLQQRGHWLCHARHHSAFVCSIKIATEPEIECTGHQVPWAIC